MSFCFNKFLTVRTKCGQFRLQTFNKILKRCLSKDINEQDANVDENVIRNTSERIDFRNVHLAKFLLENFSKYGNATALINGDTGKQVTYNELECKILKTANFLIKLGIKKGDVVTLFSANNLDYPAVVLGVSLIGAVCNTVNNLYNADEVKKLVMLARPSIIITTPPLQSYIDEILNECPFIRHKLLVGDDSANYLGSDYQYASTDVPDIDIDMDDVTALPFSSGTTGVPKGVQLTHRSIVCNLQQAIHPKRLDCLRNDRLLAVLPYFHLYGYMANMLSGLLVGSTQVVMAKFDPKIFLKCLNEHHCTFISAVPPMLLFLCRHPLAINSTFPHIRRIVTGAAPTPASLIEEMRKKLNKDAVIKQAYGLTEASPVISIAENSFLNAESVGQVLPHTEIKIVDENDNILPRNKTGELCARGPQIMKGYFKNETANKESFMDGGWLRTGDIALVDTENNIYVVDRKKDLIKVKGFQVAPAELESILLSHPSVADTAVIGVPDDQLGEKPRAYVVLKSAGSIQEEDLIKFVAGKVAPFKQLLGGVHFVTEIPKSPTGKILKRILRQQTTLE